MKRFIALILLVFTLFGCSAEKSLEPVSQTDFLLNTVATITIYNMDKTAADKIILDTFALCREYENKLSKTIATSEVSAINNSNGNWVAVSQKTRELIELSEKYSKISDGKFDITIAPVTAIWDFSGEKPVIPNQSDIAEALSHVGYENIEINGNNVRLKDSKTAIDLGGIAKGYIGDMAKDFLVKNGVQKAFVNLGGNILTIGPGKDEIPFKMGIQKPFDAQSVLYGIIDVKNLSVVTSGTYERYFKLDEKLYHHILDTKTGYPTDNGLLSVTIIGPSSANADALSTTCFVLGLEDGMALIEDTENTEAIFITSDYKPHYSSGINNTIKFELSNSD